VTREIIATLPIDVDELRERSSSAMPPPTWRRVAAPPAADERLVRRPCDLHPDWIDEVEHELAPVEEPGSEV